MNTEKIARIFFKYKEPSRALINFLDEYTEIIHYPKKTKLLKEGQISQHIYFILSGSIRIHSYDQQGNNQTSSLLFENDLVLSVFSFFSNKPSVEAIETIEDCEIIKIPKKQLEKIYEDFPEFNYFGRRMTEEYYINSEKRIYNLRMLSAKDRYFQFIEENQQALKRIPLRYIASYLGINLSTLSRIRANT